MRLAENAVLVESSVRVRESTAVAMNGANSVRVELSVLSAVVGGVEVTATVEESNNLENWSEVSNGTGGVTGIGYTSFTAPDVSAGERITAAYVRLVWAVEETGASETVVISSGLETDVA